MSKEIGNSTLPDWARKYASAFFSISPFPYPFPEFNPEFKSRILKMVAPSMIQSNVVLGTNLVCCLDIDATQIVKAGDSKVNVLFYNVYHAALIKSLVYQAMLGSPQSKVFEFLRDFASSQLYNRGRIAKAFMLKDEKASFFYTNTNPLSPGEYSLRAQISHKYLPKIPFQGVLDLVDQFILTHEIGHFRLSQKDPFIAQMHANAMEIFESVLNSTHPTDFARFKAATNNWGFKIDQEYYNNLMLERERLLRDKSRLVEELTCDMFATWELAKLHFYSHQEAPVSPNSAKSLFSSIFLVAQASQFIQHIRDLTFKYFEKKGTSEISNEMFFRNAFLLSTGTGIIENLKHSYQGLIPIGFEKGRENFSFDGIRKTMNGVKDFFDNYLTLPFGKSLWYMAQSTAAKSSSDELRSLYERHVDLVDQNAAIQIATPHVENFILSEYFSFE